MAGHSKFKNIMHRKGAQDKKRSKLFSKLARDITVAAKSGMPDPDMNPRLRLAVNNAKAQSMPKDNIDRAIKKASSGEDDNLEDVRYEGFGPEGIGIIVEALTDNRNRTAGAVRSIFSKNGGNLGETGSVSFMFDNLGQIIYDADVASEDDMFEAAIEAGAQDVEPNDIDTDDDGNEIKRHIIWTAREDLQMVIDGLSEKFGDPLSTNIVWKPQNTITVTGDKVSTLIKLMDALEDDDDVQAIYANCDIPDEELAKLDI